MDDTKRSEEYRAVTSHQLLEQVVAHLLTPTGNERSKPYSKDDLLKVCILLLNGFFYNSTGDAVQLAFYKALGLAEQFDDVDLESAKDMLCNLIKIASQVRSRNYVSRM